VTVVTRLWIKICGMRTRESIEAAASAGADAVGFVFHEGSPRNLDLDEARELQRAVPADIERVAVFMHPPAALVEAVVSAIRPDWVQTDAEDCAGLLLPAGQRTLPVLRSGRSLPEVLPPRCLLESVRSGMGERADWTDAARLACTTELVLAGGLDESNVADAVCRVRPFGLDVSSGVESSRGVKDAARIRGFIRAARAAEPDPAEENRR
jgi:phosphoribosylanthranilate isomerase